MSEFLSLASPNKVANVRSIRLQYSLDYSQYVKDTGRNPIAEMEQKMSGDEKYATFDEIINSGEFQYLIEAQAEMEHWSSIPASVANINSTIIPGINSTCTKFDEYKNEMYDTVMKYAKQGIDPYELIDYALSGKKYGSVSTVGKLNPTQAQQQAKTTTDEQSAMKVVENMLTEAEMSIVHDPDLNINLTEKLPDGSPRYLLIPAGNNYHIYDMANKNGDGTRTCSVTGFAQGRSLFRKYAGDSDRMSSIAGGVMFVVSKGTNKAASNPFEDASISQAIQRFVSRGQTKPVFAVTENGLQEVSTPPFVTYCGETSGVARAIRRGLVPGITTDDLSY